VSPRTVSPPPTDRRMWRRLIARAHPDTGGADDLFVWARSVYEHVVGDRIEDRRTRAERRRPPPHPTTGERIDFTRAFDVADDFEDLTERIVALADSGGLPERYASLLRLIADCCPAQDGPLYRAQHQGATYKTLAAIGHRVGMDAAQRGRWYEVCEAIPLSQRHAGHIMSKIKREAA
jgi:hypothetical protein